MRGMKPVMGIAEAARFLCFRLATRAPMLPNRYRTVRSPTEAATARSTIDAAGPVFALRRIYVHIKAE